MNGKLILGSLLAGIVLMVTGFIFWGVLSDQLGIVEELPNESATIKGLADSVPEEGTYFFPVAGAFSEDEGEQAAWAARHTEGPIGFLHYRRPGIAPNMGLVMFKGFVHFVISAFLLGLVLNAVLPAAPDFGQRMKVVVLVVLFATVAMQLSSSIWWYVPWTYALYSMITTLISYLLAGLVLAKFIRPA